MQKRFVKQIAPVTIGETVFENAEVAVERLMFGNKQTCFQRKL